MKYFFAIFLFIFSFSNVSSQEMVDTTASIGVVKSYELRGDAYEAWNKIQTDWMKNEYSKILKSNKLKMNCNGCENIFMDAVIQIDSVGKMTYYKMINSKKCAETFSKALEIQFMKYFFKCSFPAPLFKMRFEIRLGTGLKC